MRVLLFSALVVLIATATGLSTAAQELARHQRPAIRVAPAAATGSAMQPMQSPVLGFVSTSAGQVGSARRMHGMGLSSAVADVRAIIGVPGAASLSGPLSMPRGVERVYLSPGGSFGLAEQSAGAMAVVQFSGMLALPLQAVSGAIEQPAIVAFSPGGSAAAVLSTEEGRLQVLAGLPASPRIARSLNLSDLPANIRTLALADDAVTLLAGTADGSVLALRTGKTAQLLFSAHDLGGIAFAPASTNALLFDRDGNRAMMIENIATSPSTRMLAEGVAGITGDVVLGFDGGAAIVGAINARQLSRINLQTLQVDTVNLPVALTMLQPLQAAHRFLISSQSGQPAWIVDTSRETAAVYFVPRQARPVLAR